jgi:hypothetical protein
LKDRNFDECFSEYNKYTKWIHIALYNSKKLQRKKVGKLYV